MLHFLAEIKACRGLSGLRLEFVTLRLIAKKNIFLSDFLWKLYSLNWIVF
jgi:hypothetical protein